MKKFLAILVACAACLRLSADQRGTASWYGLSHAGLTMANGHPFDPGKLTCATYAYPLGTVLRVTYGARTVRVVVTDRGPARRLGRLIDLSRAAFARLAPVGVGLITVTVAKSK